MKKAKKERLDLILVQRQLCESREKAKRLILAGKVKVENLDCPKPGHLVAADIAITIATPERFVSRGGLKLEHALISFDLSVSDRVCADIGASTGGFTDCMCQFGAKKVYSVDVGITQLHESLKNRSKIVILDHTNAKELKPEMFNQGTPDFFSMDVSFISVLKILPFFRNVFPVGTEAVILIKPQFEANRSDVSRGKGVISDPIKHKEIVTSVLDSIEELGWHIHGLINSPVTGGSGNREFLTYLILREASADKSDWKSRIAIDDVIFDENTTLKSYTESEE